jgi:hypothetical protein
LRGRRTLDLTGKDSRPAASAGAAWLSTSALGFLGQLGKENATLESTLPCFFFTTRASVDPTEVPE